jgi:hypothetical protein
MKSKLADAGVLVKILWPRQLGGDSLEVSGAALSFGRVQKSKNELKRNKDTISSSKRRVC